MLVFSCLVFICVLELARQSDDAGGQLTLGMFVCSRFHQLFGWFLMLKICLHKSGF